MSVVDACLFFSFFFLYKAIQPGAGTIFIYLGFFLLFCCWFFHSHLGIFLIVGLGWGIKKDCNSCFMVEICMKFDCLCSPSVSFLCVSANECWLVV